MQAETSFMTFEGIQLQGAQKIMEKLNVSRPHSNLARQNFQNYTTHEKKLDNYCRTFLHVLSLQTFVTSTSVLIFLFSKPMYSVINVVFHFEKFYFGHCHCFENKLCLPLPFPKNQNAIPFLLPFSK